MHSLSSRQKNQPVCLIRLLKRRNNHLKCQGAVVQNVASANPAQDTANQVEVNVILVFPFYFYTFPCCTFAGWFILQLLPSWSCLWFVLPFISFWYHAVSSCNFYTFSMQPQPPFTPHPQKKPIPSLFKFFLDSFDGFFLIFSSVTLYCFPHHLQVFLPFPLLTHCFPHTVSFKFCFLVMACAE